MRTGHFRIFDQWRCMMRLASSIDHPHSRAAPMLIFDEFADPIDVGGWIQAVNVTQTKLLIVCAVNSLSSTITIIGKPSISRSAIPSRGVEHWSARTPGMQILGSENPTGSWISAGS